jgi:CYTH domain-containing protein
MLEIERKFLLNNEGWRNKAVGKLYLQGYIRTQNPETTVRVRVVGEQGYLTIKGKSQGAARAEFEYEIPVAEATIMLEKLCDRPLIAKKRYKIEYKGLIWEVDEFMGENEGLILAEVELETAEQEIVLPDWIGKEVTGDLKYYNASLAQNPYQSW